MKNELKETDNTQNCVDAEASSACIVRCNECGKTPQNVESDFHDYSFTFLDYWIECECGRRTRDCMNDENAIDEWYKMNT